MKCSHCSYTYTTQAHPPTTRRNPILEHSDALSQMLNRVVIRSISQMTFQAGLSTARPFRQFSLPLLRTPALCIHSTLDLLEYLLRQGKITVEQKTSYGESQSLEISLESAAAALTFSDWEYSSKDGISLEGVAEQDIDYIRRELLPLFVPD